MGVDEVDERIPYRSVIGNRGMVMAPGEGKMINGDKRDLILALLIQSFHDSLHL